MTKKILRRLDLEAKTGLSRSTIYAKMDAKGRYFDPTFPAPVRLGKRAVGWRESEIDAWLESRSREVA